MASATPRRPMTDKVWRMAALLDRWLEVSDISGAAARLDGGAALLAARERCIECTECTLCEARLAAGATGPTLPRSCPNAAFMRRCQALERPGVRHPRAAGA